MPEPAPELKVFTSKEAQLYIEHKQSFKQRERGGVANGTRLFMGRDQLVKGVFYRPGEKHYTPNVNFNCKIPIDPAEELYPDNAPLDAIAGTSLACRHLAALLLFSWKAQTKKDKFDKWLTDEAAIRLAYANHGISKLETLNQEHLASTTDFFIDSKLGKYLYKRYQVHIFSADKQSPLCLYLTTLAHAIAIRIRHKQVDSRRPERWVIDAYDPNTSHRYKCVLFNKEYISNLRYIDLFSRRPIVSIILSSDLELGEDSAGINSIFKDINDVIKYMREEHAINCNPRSMLDLYFERMRNRGNLDFIAEQIIGSPEHWQDFYCEFIKVNIKCATYLEHINIFDRRDELIRKCHQNIMRVGEGKIHKYTKHPIVDCPQIGCAKHLYLMFRMINESDSFATYCVFALTVQAFMFIIECLIAATQNKISIHSLDSVLILIESLLFNPPLLFAVIIMHEIASMASLILTEHLTESYLKQGASLFPSELRRIINRIELQENTSKQVSKAN